MTDTTDENFTVAPYGPMDMAIGDKVRINGQEQIVDSVPSIPDGPFSAHYYGRDGGEIRGIYWAVQIDQSVAPFHEASQVELIEKGDGTPRPVALLPGEPAPVLDDQPEPAPAKKATE